MDDSNGRISHDPQGRGTVEVRAVVLDEVLREEPRIDLIKMDVEGAEARVLRGLARIVRRDRPVVFSEFSPYGLRLASSIEPGDYLDLIRGHGYDLGVIVPGGIEPAPANRDVLSRLRQDGHEHHLDLLATPR